MKIIVYKGGKIQLDGKRQFNGKAYLLFNCSQYRDCYQKKGHFWVSKTGKVSLCSSERVLFYSGCKIDVNGGHLELGGGYYFQ